MKKFKFSNIPGIAYGIVALIIFFTIFRPKFISPTNLILILRNTSILAIASIGMTLAILISQIDMSIGGIMCFVAVILALLTNAGIPSGITIIICLAIGLLIGFVNGLLIGYYKFDFWIVTFATMSITEGFALVMTNGVTVAFTNGFLDFLGNGSLGGFYILIILAIIFCAIMMFVSTHTKFGSNIYSVGGNEKVAAVSGINVVRLRIGAYMLSGFFAAVAGILISCMSDSGSPVVGTDYSFNAIAAVIIGGASFAGGSGTLGGTILGALLLRVLASGLSIMGISSTWQKAIIGFVIVTLIVTDVLTENRRKRNSLRRVYKDV